MEKTRLQWAKNGYVVNDGETGIFRWTSRWCTQKSEYFSENQVHMDIESAKSLIREKNKEYYHNYKIKKKEIDFERKMRDDYKTKYQWEEVGRIPLETAKPILGETLNNRFKQCPTYGSTYYYYHKKDTCVKEDKNEI